MLNWLNQKGFFHLLSVKFLIQFLGFGTSLLVAKFLTPVELGEVKILQSYSMVFFIAGGFGISAAVLKLCSENMEPEDKHRILKMSVKRIMLTGGAAFALISALSLSGLITSSRHLAVWLVIYSLTIPFAVITDLLACFLQACKKIKEMARAQGLIKFQSFILIVLSTWRWGFKGFVVATVAAYIAGTIPLIRQVGIKFIRSKPIALPSAFNSLAGYSVLSNGTSIIAQYCDIFILDHFVKNRAEIGFYGLATLFVLAAMEVTGAAQSIVTPYFSEREHDTAWVRRQLILNQLRAIALALITAAGVWLFAYILISTVYGPKYLPTMQYLHILLLRYLVWSAYAIIAGAMLGLGLVRSKAIASIINMIASFTLCYLFVGKWSVTGVAWAQVAATAITLLTYLILILFTLNRTER